MAPQLSPEVDVRRAGDRYRTELPWLVTRHSFSSGHHYDPANTSFGLLVAHDEHVVAPGAGFAAHPHRDTEIVTWVLDGALLHEDSQGHRAVVRPGTVQRVSAGSGIRHAEMHDPSGGAAPVRFVQAWVLPDDVGTAPRVEQADIGQALQGGGLVPLASGVPGLDAPVGLGSRSAALHAGRLPSRGSVLLPDAAHVHLFVALGSVALEGAGALGPGDAARLTARGGGRVTASEPAEVLVWELHTRR